jgi:hypothetical protein
MIVDLNKSHGHFYSQADNNKVKKFLTGYNHIIQDLRQRGLLPVQEGKDPMKYSGFKWLAGRTYNIRSTSQFIQINLYVLLIWNIGARNGNIGKMLFEHISWEHDALSVVLPLTKNSRKGENNYKKHIYANPLDPCK